MNEPLFSFSPPLQPSQPRPLNPLPLAPGGSIGRFPSWLHQRLPETEQLLATHRAVSQLATVCQQARCPNLAECYAKKSATFLAMGHQCTRQCGFCSIEHHKQPPPLDPEEPYQIAEAAEKLGLRHVVLTQVARDDLIDGGASHLVAIIQTVRSRLPHATLELLTSDFEGRYESLKLVMEAEPEVFNHNIETVRSLSPRVRHRASYERTLQLLRSAAQLARGKTRLIKSGLMVGLGEQDEEVEQTLVDLYNQGVQVVTIGQYLQSTRQGLLVRRFVPPEQFDRYREFGLRLGLLHVYSAPFVRSSYNAQLFVEDGA